MPPQLNSPAGIARPVWVRTAASIAAASLVGAGLFGCAQERAVQRANSIPAQYKASLLEGLWFIVARTNFLATEGNTRENLTFNKQPEPQGRWKLTYRGWSNQRGLWFEEFRNLTESGTGLLVGSVFGLSPAPLYIVAKDRSERALLIATSSRRRFFIISRDPAPDALTLQSLLEEARANQLPVEELLFLQNP